MPETLVLQYKVTPHGQALVETSSIVQGFGIEHATMLISTDTTLKEARETRARAAVV